MTLLVSIETFTDYVRNGLGVVDSSHLTSALNVADQAVKAVCRRDFAVASITPTTRSFVPTWGSDTLRIPDCTSVASITVDGAVADVSAYQTEPVELVGWDGLTRPIEQIRYFYTWPISVVGQATVDVSATWGWVAVPAGAPEAVKILGKTIVEMRSSRSGLVAETVFGPVRLPREIASQVMSLLDAGDLRRPEAVVRIG